MIQTQAGALFEKAAKSLGYHPFPQPSANASQPYVNPDGVAYGACHYCGYCERFGCEVNAKASPHFTVIPLAAKKSNFEMRTNARVLKVNLDAARKRAESVTYIDASGREFEQPADLVILAAYALSNVHLMLLSGIGTPYDPVDRPAAWSAATTPIRSAAAPRSSSRRRRVNPFMGAGACGIAIDEFNGDSFDHSGKEGFIGGGGISTAERRPDADRGRPVPPGTPTGARSGSARSCATTTSAASTVRARVSYRQNYLDLDPTYRDANGLPLLRMTFDLRRQRAQAGDLDPESA